MKNLRIIILLMSLLCLSNSSNAQQVYGKWVLPVGTNTMLITFTENGILQPLEQLPTTFTGSYCEIAAGGYNENYDLEFYILEKDLCYGNYSIL